MDPKEFAEYIRDRSPSQLLHHAREGGLKCILTYEDASRRLTNCRFTPFRKREKNALTSKKIPW